MTLMRRVLAIGLVLATASAVAQERDKKAVRLAAKGAKLAKEAQPIWKAFFEDPGALPARDLSRLIDAYETAIDRFHESLEVEEHSGVNGQILSLARRLAKLRFEEMTREARARQEAKRAKEKRQPAPKPVPEEKPAPPEEPEPPPEEPEPATPRPARVARRELVEPADLVRRNTQRLRNFLMHEYFANRKFSKMVLRCTRCNGRGKVASGVLDRRRRPVYVTCGTCDGAGARLKEEVARKAYWLVKSPQYRSDPARLAAFSAELEGWRADPRTVPEFLKSLRIVSIDYHGLWATAECHEKGYVPATKRAFQRKVKRMFVRFGRRWFLFDENTDEGVFDPDAE